MAAELRGAVWLATDGRILISDYRDYSRVLEQARELNPQVKVKLAAEGQIPADAERVI